MSYSYDKDEIKNNLTIEQVESYVADLGGEPQHSSNCLICKTICHGGEANKLSKLNNPFFKFLIFI